MSETKRDVEQVNSVYPELDAYFPPLGKCQVCGMGDARHRTVDAVASRVRAGDPVDEVAEDFGVPIEAVWLALGNTANVERSRGR